ncbi:hypothetical protein R3W88_004625 [Solanum pinnatisectum]|uniref:NAC domain-containing protein n=1 Tax=Solanum pinnatisectum TaxID=50273 RepID=A0AAV9KDE0_9SOLN|nr:hypothetical protein R3W88_004625 [Solanum pinnatisectum]
MGTNIDDEQLIGYLINFVTGMPVECDEIRVVDLYGNKKPSQLFETTTTNHHHHNGKNFNRAIVGRGGSRKESYAIEHVVDKNKSVIGIKKEFRFKEENHVWIMKEYSLIDSKLKDLSGRIQHEGFVVFSSSSQCQGSVKSFAQENHDECSVLQEVVHQETHPDVYTLPLIDSMFLNIPEPLDGNISQVDECSVPVVHQQTPSVSLLPKESNVTAANEEECSVSEVHEETPSVSFFEFL